MKQKLESRIGYRFRDARLLDTAVTHSSYANERHSPDVVSYENSSFKKGYGNGKKKISFDNLAK